jgi:hypothetical protein
MWELTFNGQNAILKHEQGLAYVAYLLLNPPAEPIHALDLATRVAALDRKDAGLSEIVDPVTGKSQILESHARLQERSLGLEQAQVMRATLRREHRLEDLLELEETTEPEKEEAQRELIQLYRYEGQNTAATRDNAQRCVRAVRIAIKRFHQHLGRAILHDGSPNRTLRSFADYLQYHLIIPSSRYAGRSVGIARNGLAGCFTHEPPKDVTWT